MRHLTLAAETCKLRVLRCCRSLQSRQGQAALKHPKTILNPRTRTLNDPLYRGLKNWNKVWGVYYTTIIIRSPQKLVLIIKAPTCKPSATFLTTHSCSKSCQKAPGDRVVGGTANHGGQLQAARMWSELRLSCGSFRHLFGSFRVVSGAVVRNPEPSTPKPYKLKP